MEKQLNCLSAPDMKPIVHGYGIHYYRCSICDGKFGASIIEDFNHNRYCADCGATMDGE